MQTSFTDPPICVAAVPLFNELHWLPVTIRSDYKIAALAYLRFDSTRTYSPLTIQLLSAQTVRVILTLLYVFSMNVVQVLKEVIPKDKNVFVIHQNVQKWMGF